MYTPTMRISKNIAKKAIKQAGGPVKVSKLLGISHQAIGQWKLIPPKWVIKIEEISGISRNELRPDIYPDE